MSNIESFATGLSNALTAYLGAKNKQTMTQQNLTMQSNLEQQNQQQQLQNQKDLIDYKTQQADDNSSFDPAMAESIRPGLGKVIQAYADSNDGNYPTYSDGVKLLSTFKNLNPDTVSKGPSPNKAQVSGKTLGTMMAQLGGDPSDITAVSAIPQVPSGLAEGFLSKVYKNGQQTPAQQEIQYRSLNPYVADLDSKTLKQSPDYAEFINNMTADGKQTLDDSQFPEFVSNATKFVQSQVAAYQKQGLAQGPAYTKSLTAASRLAANYPQAVKRRLMNAVHLNILQQQQQQQPQPPQQ